MPNDLTQIVTEKMQVLPIEDQQKGGRVRSSVRQNLKSRLCLDKI
jgi:hypothetical protein